MLKKPLSKVKVCVKGISYRKGVKELYYSRNLALVELLRDKGVDVYVNDELFTNEEVQELGLKWGKLEDADIIFDSFNLGLSDS
jgi:UDP-N-acetyl-D-mannosaminuronic acid dehydrogenase